MTANTYLDKKKDSEDELGIAQSNFQAQEMWFLINLPSFMSVL